MNDRPINFAAPMVRALLDGRKTQTRRLIKEWRYGAPRLPYMPGDRLYVREAHYLTDTGDCEIVVFAEDADAVRDHFDLINGLAAQHGLSETWKAPHLKLRPSIHMPRWASRLTLTVTEVMVQRLQEISEVDAWAEGCTPGDLNDRGEPFPAEEPHPKGGSIGWDCAIDWYADLWNSLHGAEAWDANPWVVAVSFTAKRGNIDA